VLKIWLTTSPANRAAGTIDGLAEYIVKNIHEAQERDKKLMDAQRKMGQLIEREFIEYGLHPSVKYQDWVKSTRHQKITQNNFYYSRLLVAIPEFNVLSESTDKDYFLENRTAHKFWSIIVLNISQSDHAFDKLIRCIELFREGRNNADIARELRWNEGRVENARNILVNLRVLKREKT
jgi:hypothetical protein